MKTKMYLMDFSMCLAAALVAKGIKSIRVEGDDFFRRFEKAFNEFTESVPEGWKPNFRIRLSEYSDSENVRMIIHKIAYGFNAGHYEHPDYDILYLHVSERYAKHTRAEYPEEINKLFDKFVEELMSQQVLPTTS